MKHEINTGTFVDANKTNLTDWFDKWLNTYAKLAVRKTTWESYKTQVEQHIKPRIGNIKLTSLNTGHLQKLYNDLLINGRVDGKGGLSPRTVRYTHMIIHSALEQAIKEHIIRINPSDAVRLPRDIKKEMQTLDTDNIKMFMNTAKQTRYYSAYMLELTSGLRRGELLGLRWKDIDLVNGTIQVVQQLIRTRNGLEFSEPKTKISRRTINIPENTVKTLKTLKTHKIKQAEEKLKAGGIYQNNDLVFCTEIGKPIDPKNFVRSFQSTLEKAGLDKIRFHDMRHTFSVLSLQAGVSIKAIQEALGHHTPAFTMEVYGHVNKQMKQEASEKIGKIVARCI